MTYKELITRLQILPAPLVKVKIYPEITGKDNGSRYYLTGIDGETLVGLGAFIQNGFLREAKRLALEGRGKKNLQDLAKKITEGKPTLYDKVEAMHHWIFKNVEYQRTSYIVPPWKLIEPETSGDCKSFACLISSLLGITGVPSWFKLVSFKDTFTPRHIYNNALISWQPVDGTGAYCFSEVKGVTGYILYEVDRTESFPPKTPLTEEAVPWIPPQLEYMKKFLPLLALGGAASLGLILSIGLYKRREKIA